MTETRDIPQKGDLYRDYDNNYELIIEMVNERWIAVVFTSGPQRDEFIGIPNNMRFYKRYKMVEKYI